MSSGLLRIDADVPVYRIFPLWFFEEALRLKQLVLVRPDQWEDPYEILASSVVVRTRAQSGDQMPLEPHLKPAYVQCWSSGKESDTLLRAYSRVVKDPHAGRNTCPRDEGVRVRSTPRKLLSALCAWSPSLVESSCFVGAVTYMEPNAVQQYFGDGIGRRGMKAFETGAARAEALLLKRTAFQHESEVRLIYVEERRHAPEQQIIRVPIDPNDVFEEVTYDSRLSLFERMEREAVAKTLGYAGKITQSDLYQKLLLIVIVDNLGGVM